jgi:glutathione S-transferase
MLELYHHNTSVCAVKVRLVLAEKALDWHGHYIDIIAGEQFTPAFAKLNPKCEVPVLVTDGRPIRESTLINEYLEDAYPETPLRPDDAYERAQMRLWCKVPDDGLHFACADLTFAAHHRHRILGMSEPDREVFLASTRDPRLRERKRAAVLEGFATPFLAAAVQLNEKVLDEMNRQLSRTPWLAGQDYTLADVSLTPYVNRIAMLGFGDRWPTTMPDLADWFVRIQARANFTPAVRDWLPQKLVDEMRQNGLRCLDEYAAAAAAN